MMRPSPSAQVLRWLAEHPPSRLFTTTITQAEILYGLELLPAGKRRAALEFAIEAARLARSPRLPPLAGRRAVRQRNSMLRSLPSPAPEGQSWRRATQATSSIVASLCWTRGPPGRQSSSVRVGNHENRAFTPAHDLRRGRRFGPGLDRAADLDPAEDHRPAIVVHRSKPELPQSSALSDQLQRLVHVRGVEFESRRQRRGGLRIKDHPQCVRPRGVARGESSFAAVFAEESSVLAKRKPAQDSHYFSVPRRKISQNVANADRFQRRLARAGSAARQQGQTQEANQRASGLAESRACYPPARGESRNQSPSRAYHVHCSTDSALRSVIDFASSSEPARGHRLAGQRAPAPIVAAPRRPGPAVVSRAKWAPGPGWRGDDVRGGQPVSGVRRSRCGYAASRSGVNRPPASARADAVLAGRGDA